MANIIKPKRTSVSGNNPTTGNLASGEIAVNMADKRIFINNGSSIVQIGSGFLSGLGDVSLSTLSAGQTLAWNGTAWINSSAGAGDVVGAASSTNNALVRFDGTTGKLIKNSVVTLDDTGNMAGVATITDINYVDFNTGYSTALGTGQMGWDATNNSLAYGMANGNIVQHIGEDQFLYIKASSAITKGQVIMFTGSVGASGVLTGAPATGITDGTYIMGVAAESIALNGFGFVQTFGVINNVNTTGFADGDILWYNPAVTGGLTNTKPSAPNVKAQIAACNKGGSAGGGVITVRVNPGSILGGTDSNVQFGTLATGDLIRYNGTYWTNVATIPNSNLANSSITINGSAISLGGTVSVGTVTSVTGTAPISVATGTTTPAISISQANSTTNGYLSSTDWNTFNNKGSGTVTSVGGTGTVAGITLTGTVTSSGNLTLGGTFALPNGQVPAKMIYDTFTATASQTTFTPSTTYTASKIEVYVNGVKMRNGTDVTVTSGTSVVFATGLAVGSLVDLVYPT